MDIRYNAAGHPRDGVQRQSATDLSVHQTIQHTRFRCRPGAHVHPTHPCLSSIGTFANPSVYLYMCLCINYLRTPTVTYTAVHSAKLVVVYVLVSAPMHTQAKLCSMISVSSANFVFTNLPIPPPAPPTPTHTHTRVRKHSLTPPSRSTSRVESMYRPANPPDLPCAPANAFPRLCVCVCAHGG